MANNSEKKSKLGERERERRAAVNTHENNNPKKGDICNPTEEARFACVSVWSPHLSLSLSVRLCVYVD